MDTLSNVNKSTPQIPCSRFTSAAIPRAESSQTGVSVEYVPDPDKHWYIFRVSYHREDVAADMLIKAGIYAYVVKRYRWVEVDKRRKRILESLLPNLLFAYVTPAMAEVIIRDNNPQQPSPCPKLAALLSYYYDHFNTDAFGKNPPAVVAEAEMLNFIRATSTHNEHLMLLSGNDFRFKGGEEVLITNGEFKGVRGRVIRARGQQRVLVRLTDFADLATAYIPTGMMEVISD